MIDFDMNHPMVTVVVPAYNEERFIQDCLKGLLEQDYPTHRCEILVVDNGSSDSTVEKVRALGVRVISFPCGKVGAVRNEGAKNAVGEVLAFIDADCVAGKHWISCAVDSLKDSSLGAVGGVCRLRENPSWVENSWILGDRLGDRETGSLAGSSFILKKELFVSLGGFDEKVNAGEDTKLSHNIKSKGYNLYFMEECSVVHLGYPSRISEFMVRQFWQASSYFRSNNGFGDKVFLATVAFLLSLASMMSFFAFNSWGFTLLFFAITIFISSSFTIKRVFMGGYSNIKIKSLPGAFILDYLYFLSRSAGLVVGLFFDPFRRS